MSTQVTVKVRDFIKDNFMFRDDRAELADTESLLDAGTSTTTLRDMPMAAASSCAR